MSLWLLFLDVVSNRLCQLEILKRLQRFSSECCSHMFHTRLEKPHSRHLNCRHCWCGTGSFYSSTFQKAPNIHLKNSAQIPVYPTVQDKQIYLASARLESSGFEVIQRVWGPPWGQEVELEPMERWFTGWWVEEPPQGLKALQDWEGLVSFRSPLYN